MIRIGISGWTYAPWRGVFFPEGVPQNRELEFASRNFRSIEINGTFYGLQKPDAFRTWYEQTPDGFVFSVKGSRYITHLKRLNEIERTLPNLLASGVLELREKLGPFLWQFPPNFRFEPERFELFLQALPHSTPEVAEIARHHDTWMEGRVTVEHLVDQPVRHCVEVRHDSFLVPEFFTMLRKHDVAFVFADSAGHWPYAEDITSDFLYLRLHGAEELYASGYTEVALDWWADRIRKWTAGEQPSDSKLVLPAPKRPPKVRDVYVYFDNDVKVRAPFNARALADRLGVGLPPPSVEEFVRRRKSKRVEEEPRNIPPGYRKSSVRKTGGRPARGTVRGNQGARKQKIQNPKIQSHPGAKRSEVKR